MELVHIRSLFVIKQDFVITYNRIEGYRIIYPFSGET